MIYVKSIWIFVRSLWIWNKIFSFWYLFESLLPVCFLFFIMLWWKKSIAYYFTEWQHIINCIFFSWKLFHFKLEAYCMERGRWFAHILRYRNLLVSVIAIATSIEGNKHLVTEYKYVVASVCTLLSVFEWLVCIWLGLWY